MGRLLVAVYLFQWLWHVLIAATQKDALLAVWMAQCGVLAVLDDDGNVTIRSAARMSFISRFIVVARFRQGPRLLIALALLQNVCQLWRLLTMTRMMGRFLRFKYKTIWTIHNFVCVCLLLGCIYRNILVPIESGSRLSGLTRLLLFVTTTPGRRTFVRNISKRRTTNGVPSFKNPSRTLVKHWKMNPLQKNAGCVRIIKDPPPVPRDDDCALHLKRYHLKPCTRVHVFKRLRLSLGHVLCVS